MLLGILSDTHDKVDATRAALRALDAAGAQTLVHCGDVGSERILDELAGTQCRFVWGNNDWDRDALHKYAAALGLICCDTFGDFELSGRKIAFTHGDDTTIVRKVLAEQSHDYLFTGHSHIPHDQQRGGVRWINPGALHRARPRTCAILDLTTGDLKFLTISTP